MNRRKPVEIDTQKTEEEIERLRKQKEAEEKLIEETVARRVENEIARRVEEEIARRRPEIEAEVARRVEEAKRVLEQQMLEDLERQRKAQEDEQKRQEVKELASSCLTTPPCHHQFAQTLNRVCDDIYIYVVCKMNVQNSRSAVQSVNDTRNG